MSTTQTQIHEHGDILLSFKRGKISKTLAGQQLALSFHDCVMFSCEKEIKSQALILAAAMSELYDKKELT